MQSKFIILSIIVVTIIGISIAGNMGSQDDARYKTNHITYETAKDFIEQAKGAQAISTLVSLKQKYPHDYGIMKNLALAYGQAGQTEKAIEEFKAALNQRPSLIIDGLFSAQYADTLYIAKRYDEALVLYTNALKYNNTPQITDYLKGRVNTLSQSVKESGTK